MKKKLRKPHKEIRTAWAINTHYVDIDGSYHPGFIGKGYFDALNMDEGFRMATFRTRKLAQLGMMKRVKPKGQEYIGYPDAKVHKVKITIEECQ